MVITIVLAISIQSFFLFLQKSYSRLSCSNLNEMYVGP